MAQRPEMMLTRNVNYGAGKGGTRVSVEKYEIMKKAILKAVPSTVKGIAFTDLPDKVAGTLTPVDHGKFGSIGWYVTTVKLDLEARGLIERIPDVKPQRLRRST